MTAHQTNEGGRLIRKVFPILALSMFSSILGMGIVSPLLPLYAQSMGATGFWLGAIMAAFGAASTISTPIFGRLSDRIGRKLILCTGLLCYSAFSVAYLWADNVYSLILVRFLQGGAMGMTIPIAMAYIGDISPEREEGKWMGYSQAAFFSGFGIGPLLGGVLTEHFGITATFTSMGGLNLLAFFIATILLPEVKSRRLLTETGRNPSFREMAGSSMVRGLFFVRIAQALARGTFMTFLPIFAVMYVGLSLTLVGTLLAVNVMIMVILIALGGANIADRLNRRGLIISGSLLFLLSIALIPLAGNFWHLFILSMLMAAGGALSMPAASALTVEEGRRFGMGSTMAMLTVGMNIGMAVGPVAAGAIVDWAGIDSGFYFASAVGLIGTGLFIWFTRQQNRQ